MNRKSKIIVSIVGITIITLGLLALTYAYYLTQIRGNPTANSITLSTANLKLVYDDGNGIIVANKITPGVTVGEKTFSVTNTSGSTIKDYRVVLEYAVIENVVPSVFKYPEDFEISLTCVSKNVDTNQISGTCEEFTGTWNNESFEMIKNSIDSGIKHEYTLTIFYRDSGINQSDDMNKNLNLKVQIYGSNDTVVLNGKISGTDSSYVMKLNSNPKISTLQETVSGEYKYKFEGVEEGTHTLSLIDSNGNVVSTETITINKGNNSIANGNLITVNNSYKNIYLNSSNNNNNNNLSVTMESNPYTQNTKTLAYNIINNAMTNKNGTEFKEEPDTKIAEEISWSKGSGEYGAIILDISSWQLYDTQSEAQSNGPFGGDRVTECTNDMKGKYLFDNDNEKIEGPITGCSNGKPTLKGNEIFNTEKTLSISTDDYGNSYYYRGDVKDNYVNFAGMCWRIVRIQGDGSIKLILDDKNEPCNDVQGNDINKNGTYYSGNWVIGTGNYGYTYSNLSGEKYLTNYLQPSSEAENSMVKAFYDFQTSKLTGLTDYLKPGDWCIADKTYIQNGTYPKYTYTSTKKTYDLSDIYYDSYTRLYVSGKSNGYNPTLKCEGSILTKFANVANISSSSLMYVGTISANEVAYAGGKAFTGNQYFYLNNGSSNSNFWTLSPSMFNYYYGYDFAFYYTNNHFSNEPAIMSYNFRPAIILKAGTLINNGGEGTKDNPYVIN